MNTLWNKFVEPVGDEKTFVNFVKNAVLVVGPAAVICRALYVCGLPFGLRNAAFLYRFILKAFGPGAAAGFALGRVGKAVYFNAANMGVPTILLIAALIVAARVWHSDPLKDAESRMSEALRHSRELLDAKACEEYAHAVRLFAIYVQNRLLIDDAEVEALFEKWQPFPCELGEDYIVMGICEYPEGLPEDDVSTTHLFAIDKIAVRVKLA